MTRSPTPDTPERDADEVLRFIERTAALLADAGWARMPARVFVALLTTDSGRLTAAELAELLQISPASVSGAVRYLMQLNLARREREPGSRRDVYTLLDDPWEEAVTGRDSVLQFWASALSDGADILGRRTPAGQRMAESTEFISFMQRDLTEMMERWREYRTKLREQQAAEAGPG